MIRTLSPLLLCLLLLAGTDSAAALECDSLESLDLPDVTVLSVKAAENPVPHCALDAQIGNSIRFRVLLPAEWNGGFVMGGGGGFVGGIDNQALGVGVLQKGYATAGTDTGHQAPVLDGSWALHDLEAIVNYGHVAVHRVTEVSKEVLEEHYGRDPSPSFFFGCSNGGRQALQEAQRYPDDFDAIVAGAPALDFGGIGASFTYITQHMYPDSDDLSTPQLSKTERALLRSRIEAACDAQDGIEDGVLNDPLACDFDPSSLACAEGGSASETEGCLEAADLAAIEAIYGGPRGPNGESLHPGFPFGAEDVDGNGWGSWLVGPAMGGPFGPMAAYGFGIGLMRYFIYQDADWDYEGYDFSTYAQDSAAIEATLDASNPDLDAFRERGGKLLLYHGWSDSALTAHRTIDYVEEVYARDDTSRSDVRLFMMPGVLHCMGGDGPSQVDWISALETWHESGTAPTELEAAFMGAQGARKICAFPQKAHYVGDDPRDPTSFECR